MSDWLKIEKALWVLFLGLLVFFGTWRQQGLQPDAAIYAGIAQKILATGEAWRLSGTSGFFGIFFEHPPYFMQWGAHVLAWLGTSDGAARAIGGIPGLLGFLLTCAWIAWRFGTQAALWAAFALATFTHYTKFAATSMLEAPLSLGTMLGAIGVFESLWGRRSLGLAALPIGLALATASKGVAGLGALGGVGLTLALAWWLDGLRFRRVLALTSLATIAALAPLAFWVWKMASLESLEWITGYFVDQVGRSAVTARGDRSHAQGGDKLFYLRMILLNDWPWWWAVPACWIAMWRGNFSSPKARRWALTSAAFAAAFLVPFSLVQFQLAHYMHPIYLPLAPIVGLFLSWAMSRTKIWLHWPVTAFRWGGLAVAALALALSAHGEARTGNRGQPFARARAGVLSLPKTCPVIVRENQMDPYRMEAYGLWYWKGHPWRVLDTDASEPTQAADWDPNHAEALERHGACLAGS